MKGIPKHLHPLLKSGVSDFINYNSYERLQQIYMEQQQLIELANKRKYISLVDNVSLMSDLSDQYVYIIGDDETV